MAGRHLVDMDYPKHLGYPNDVTLAPSNLKKVLTGLDQERDASELWPGRVRARLTILKQRLGHE